MQVGGGRGRGENHIPFAVRRDLFICFCHTIVTLRGFNNFFHRGMWTVLEGMDKKNGS